MDKTLKRNKQINYYSLDFNTPLNNNWSTRHKTNKDKIDQASIIIPVALIDIYRIFH